MARLKMDRDDVQALVRAALEHAHGSGQWIRVGCPFCQTVRGVSDDSGRGLSYNTASTGWHCWRCGTKGYLDARFANFVREPTPEELAAAEEARHPPQGYTPLWEGDGARTVLYEQAREYLLQRGIGVELWKEARIGACRWGPYAGRVVMPILSTDGSEWYGWVARAWYKTPKADRYRFPPVMPRGELIYNAGCLLVETDDPAYVVEGTFDTLAYWPDCCGLFGDISEEQVLALVGARRPIVFLLDGDAWRKGVALAMRLRLEGQRAGALRLPPLKDPDELKDKAAVWEAARLSLDTEGEVRLWE